MNIISNAHQSEEGLNPLPLLHRSEKGDGRHIIGRLDLKTVAAEFFWKVV